MAECKLCGEDKKLIRAHIIPEAFLQLPTEGDGAAKIITQDPKVYPKKTRIGIYDSGILCESCDGVLGKLDQHAVETLLQSKNVQFTGIGRDTMGRAYLDADARQIAMFIASVLWRASITAHYFFQPVKLGPYEAKIRKYLIGGTSEDESVQAILAEFDQTDVPILNPHQTRTDGVRFWLVYANRFILYTKTDQLDCPPALAQMVLTGGMNVVSVVRKWNDSKELPIIKKMALANKAAFQR